MHKKELLLFKACKNSKHFPNHRIPTFCQQKKASARPSGCAAEFVEK